MSRENLNIQFWKAAKILRQDDNTNSLLDYVEQISWLLFLKCFEELEDTRRDEAEFEGRGYQQIIADQFKWSSWTNTDLETKLTGDALLDFLNKELFPYLRSLNGDNGSSVIRALFEEAPSKMLKDGNILRDAIDVIQKIHFDSVDDTYTLSHLYESLLAKLGREGGFGGEFYTPRPIIEFMVNMVDPKLGETVYDPAMGSAGFLVEAYKHMRGSLGTRIQPADERRLQRDTFFGQEKKPLPYLLGCMNMILHGVLTPSLSRKNTLADDVRKFTEKDRFDVILTNPPFGGTEHGSVTANFRYPSKATSITFLQHIMAKVKRGGRVGMVIDDGVLFKTTEAAYVDTKKELLEHFNLNAIVSLPAGVFANAVSSGTGPKTSLLFFEKKLDEAGRPIGTKEVWYYEAKAVGFSLTKSQKPISENDLPDCFKLAQKLEVSNKSWRVPVDDLIASGYDLSASNPCEKTFRTHLTPSTILSEAAKWQQKVSDILEELQDLIESFKSEKRYELNEYTFSDLLLEDSIPVVVSDLIVYKQLTVSMHGKGVRLRSETSGHLIKTKNQYLAQAGHFIYSRIDARNGAFGIVPDHLDGAIVTGDFPCFKINTDIVLPEILRLIIRSPKFVSSCENASRGVTNRQRLKEAQLLSIPIALPSIPAQRRLLTISTMVEKAHIAFTTSSNSLDLFVPSIMSDLFEGRL